MAEQVKLKHGAEDSGTLTHRIATRVDRLKWFILAIVVLLAGGGAVFSHQRRERAAREGRAESALYQVTMVEIPANPDAGLATLGKIAEEYRGLPAGARAMISQFSFAFNTREFAAAEQVAGDFLRLYPDSPMIPRMRLALGQVMAQQGKLPQAVASFRDVISGGWGELLPEAKLALAQTLERSAEESADDPDEYRRRLEEAEAEYNDIVVRAQIPAFDQRGYWPQTLVWHANFSLAVIKDKLAGYRHQSPRGIEDAAVTPSDLEGVTAILPPSDDVSDEKTEAAAEEGDAVAEQTEGETPEGPAAPAAPAESAGGN